MGASSRGSFNDTFSSIVLVAGVNGANNNFGELLSGSLSGFVYVDANDNGLKDGSETALAGVTRRAKIPLSDEEWVRLEELAAAVSSPGFAPWWSRS